MCCMLMLCSMGTMSEITLKIQDYFLTISMGKMQLVSLFSKVGMISIRSGAEEPRSPNEPKVMGQPACSPTYVLTLTLHAGDKVTRIGQELVS
jgi:hypothetical protein